VAWTIAYGALQKKKTERMADDPSPGPEPGQVSPASPEVPRATA
jgi:hypothetical protein